MFYDKENNRYLCQPEVLMSYAHGLDELFMRMLMEQNDNYLICK